MKRDEQFEPAVRQHRRGIFMGTISVHRAARILRASTRTVHHLYDRGLLSGFYPAPGEGLRLFEGSVTSYGAWSKEIERIRRVVATSQSSARKTA